jgi:hypothetical protein
MAAKLTILTHKVAIQLHLVAESSSICSSRSRRPVRKLLDTPSYIRPHDASLWSYFCKMKIRHCCDWTAWPTWKEIHNGNVAYGVIIRISRCSFVSVWPSFFFPPAKWPNNLPWHWNYRNLMTTRYALYSSFHFIQIPEHMLQTFCQFKET